MRLTLLVTLFLLFSLFVIAEDEPVPPPPDVPSINLNASEIDGSDSQEGLSPQSLDVAQSAECSDGTKNNNETDIDCGGPCKKCEIDKNCIVDTDCDSGVCGLTVPLGSGGSVDVNTCQKATCSDGTKNQNEDGVDCGGPCDACPEQITDTDANTDTGTVTNSNSIQTVTTTSSGGSGSGSSSGNDNTVESFGSDQQTAVTANPDGGDNQNTVESTAESANQESVESVDEGGSSSFIAIGMILVAVALLVIIGITVVGNNLVTKTKPKPAPARGGAIVLKLHKQGYKPQMIRTFLLSKGWSQQQINQAFIEAKNGARRNR